MDHRQATIPIHTASAPGAAGCGGCVGDSGTPVCRTHFGQPCVAPDLRGPDELLRLALDALRTVVDPERGLNLVDAHCVAALHVDADEAELTVTFPPSCGSGRLMAEHAFQSLRRALPDTDIYVLHAS